MRARRLIKKSLETKENKLRYHIHTEAFVLETKENKLRYYIYIESFVLAKYSTLPTKIDLTNVNV
jgi:hypothetical protein